MVAQHGGAQFQPISTGCLTSLKAAIDYSMDGRTKEKKSKQTQFWHARDNAIAALGKVLKHQSGCIDLATLVPFWLNLLPLTHDMEEAKIQSQFLAEALMKSPAFILGDQYERLERVVMIFGEICCKKQSEPETLDMLSVIIANISQDANLAGQFKTLCESKLNEENRGRILETYNKCSEEVRQRVQAHMATL